jgi:hypothetical protein
MKGDVTTQYALFAEDKISFDTERDDAGNVQVVIYLGKVPTRSYVDFKEKIDRALNNPKNRLHKITTGEKAIKIASYE